MMDRLADIVVFPGWIVAASDRPGGGYRCWVVTPELRVLDDGETYESSDAAMDSGRYLVELSLELEFGNDSNL